MKTNVTVHGYADWHDHGEDDRFVVVGGTLPFLLAGRGDARTAIRDAGHVLVSYLLTKGLDDAAAYLSRRGARVEIVQEPNGAPRPDPAPSTVRHTLTLSTAS
jgi:hypothetical protein